MFKWIIVGGGIQGMTMASYLVKQNKATIEEVAIIDPHAKPLANWHRCTQTISMPYLRSPSVHHLDVNPFSLDAFVKNRSHEEAASFYGRYKRPSLSLFEHHCSHLMEELSIEAAWIQGSVKAVSKMAAGWKVHLHSQQDVMGEKLVLAIGNSEQLSCPSWAVALRNQPDAPIHHVFDPLLPSFEDMQAPYTIVGGGITAVHLAIKLNTLYPGKVTLLKRHAFRIHDFDSDPGWLGPKKQRSFRKTESYQKRRKLIADARYKGSIPRDLYIKLLHEERKRQLHVVDMEVQHAEMDNRTLILSDETGAMCHETGTVILATGFESVLPGQDWLPEVIEKNALRCAHCGYPIVSENLQWTNHLYVMGSLAELEIGPIAKNISGARQAAERIARAE